MDGCIYRTKDCECDLYAEGGKYTAFCDMENCKERKPSNADRIRNMTDEELAEWLEDRFPLPINGLWLDWLKQEAK